MIENITNPGEAPVTGDKIRITTSSGTIITKTYREPVEVEVPVSNKLTHTEFMNLVGDANMIKLLTLAKTDPVAELIVKKLDRSQIIDFSDLVNGPINGLNYLLSLGDDVLTEEEYNRILSMQP